MHSRDGIESIEKFRCWRGCLTCRAKHLRTKLWLQTLALVRRALHPFGGGSGWYRSSFAALAMTRAENALRQFTNSRHGFAFFAARFAAAAP